jgi:23S rRNA (uracil1939-C5)-methyltransferase
MALVEEGECKIVKLSSQGLGVGKTEQGAVELPYVLPGDTASFERHAYRGKSNTILRGVKEGEAARVTPPCKYFGKCGGCLLQHLTIQDYTMFKLEIAKSALSSRNLLTNLAPLITIQSGNRRRANMEAIKKSGEIFFGFHRFHSHQIINIDECIALAPDLSNIILPFKIILCEIMEDKQKLQMFITHASNGIDISIEIQNHVSLNPQQREKLLDFAQKYNITRLSFRYRKTLDVIYEQAKPYILFDNIPVEVDAYCFLQSSHESDKILSDLVLNYLKPTKNSYGVDLFCGRGTYTLPLSQHVKMDGFESDKKALAALGKASQENKREISLHMKDLFMNPVSREELAKYDLCVINPPRAGAEAQSHELAKSKIERICYISCNPETFARDAEILIAGGYVLKEVTPVDQFYWSPHLEVVGYFVR